jgi:hypothetical protein
LATIAFWAVIFTFCAVTAASAAVTFKPAAVMAALIGTSAVVAAATASD